MSGQNQPTQVEVVWQGKQCFEAAGQGGRLILDSEARAGLSPMEALLAALCGCMAVDVVAILEKMRLDLRGLRVRASALRRAEPPRSFHSVELLFQVQGALPREKVRRAVDLSLETYCSVFHTLRQDLKVEYRIELNG